MNRKSPCSEAIGSIAFSPDLIGHFFLGKEPRLREDDKTEYPPHSQFFKVTIASKSHPINIG